MRGNRSVLTERSASPALQETFQKARFKIIKIRSGEKLLDKNLEDYDNTVIEAGDGDVDADGPVLGFKSEVYIPLMGWHRIITLIFLLCWATLVYVVTFYAITFLEDRTINVTETIRSTSVGIHGPVAETY